MNFRFFLSLTLLLSLTINANYLNIESQAYYSQYPLSYLDTNTDTVNLVKYNNKHTNLSKRGVYLITSTFNNSEINQEKIPSLFIGPCSYSVIITLNNTEIYRWGEFNNPVSMTNFGASIVVLPNIKSDNNKLKFYFYSDGKNLPLPKFYINDYNKVAFSASLQTLFNLYFIQGIAIIALFSAILFFAYSAASKFKERDILYFSFFAFSIFFGYSHFLMNSPVSNDLLWFKISRIGYVLAALLLFLFCSEYTDKVKNKIFISILKLINIVIIITYSLSKNQAILNNYFSIFSILYILPLLFGGYILLWKSNITEKGISTKIIILGYTFFMLGTIHDISCVIREIDPYFWITPYGYFFLITSIILAVIFRYYNGIKDKNIAQHQLKESEEKYRQVYNAPNDGIFIQDPDTLKILDANKVALQMFGYTEQEIKSLTINDLSSNVPPYSMTEAKLHTKKLLQNDNVQTFRWHAKKKNSELFWLEVHIKKTVIANKNRILAFFSDITLRNKLEENLRQSQKMEAIGTLAGGVAHDFNNILSGIIGFTELTIMDTKENKSIQGNLNEIIKGSERARELVQQILTFSRKSSPEKKSVSLKALIEESTKLLRSSIPVNIKFDIKLESNAIIKANETQIHQLILNLCTNSYHAMQGKEGTLYIHLSDEYVHSENTMLGTKLKIGNYVKLEISDTGNGIPQKIIKRIFDPYFTTKEEGSGTGLGLSVVHGIIKDHNGEISVYSEENKGTTFNIYFPISKDLDKPFTNKNLKSVNYNGTEHILFVDDEKTITNLVSKALPKYGYKVTTCSNGDEAWKMYKKSSNDFNLLITDMTMPGMSGLDLSRKILSENKNMPIIICSGYSNFIDDKIAKEENISALMLKPINIRDLLQSIRSIIDNKQS